MSLLGRASRRYHLRHPAQFGLAIAGVALGVAVVVAIDLANESAERAFTFATDATAGAATDQIVGDSNGFEEELFARVRAGTDETAGVRAAAPVVEDFVVLPRESGSAPAAAPRDRATAPSPQVLRLLGLDPWSEAPFHRAMSVGPNGMLAAGKDLVRFLTLPGAVLLENSTAAKLGLEVGESFEVQIGARRERLTLVGLLRPPDDAGREALANLALVDIATAQEILDLSGRLTRIDLALPEGEAGAAARARLHRLLPPGVRLVRAGSRPEALEQMTRAFRFNLRALSLLALLCGTFLIYNTMTFSVVQRRELFGRLRALGVRRGEVLALVMTEAAVLGVVGSALGLLLGIALGRGLMVLVLQTIRDLYFTLAAGRFALAPLSLLKGGLLGLGASLAAALVPALEAANAPPCATLLRSNLESRAGRPGAPGSADRPGLEPHRCRRHRASRRARCRCRSVDSSSC